VVVSPSPRRGARDLRKGAPAHHVLWHELECGLYDADLGLWRELAELSAGDPPEPILDVGAGSGRVTLELARHGHRVSALDLDAELLQALREHALDAGLDVATFRADARSFELGRRDFALCIVPMQTMQLLGGAAGRSAFLSRARAHLRPGGLLACAIVTTLEPFDCAAGDIGPSAETRRAEGVLYSSRATRLQVGEQRIRIERERLIHSDRHTVAERDVVELDRLSAAQLRAEALAAGLTPEPDRMIAATAEHVGSVVVVLRG
jgi:SAM-dependent methyltransferase